MYNCINDFLYLSKTLQICSKNVEKHICKILLHIYAIISILLILMVTPSCLYNAVSNDLMLHMYLRMSEFSNKIIES